MSAEHPNHIKGQRGEILNGWDFGQLRSVNPIHFVGHSPHIEARFVGGIRIDWTPQTLIAFIRAAQEALGKLPVSYLDVADHCGGDE